MLRCQIHGLSIIIPIYREASNLPALLDRVTRVTRSMTIESEIILVDDDSDDGTEQIVSQYQTDVPIRLLIRKNHRGLASAVVYGFRSARFEVLLCMDADLSHPPESIPCLVEPIIENTTSFSIGSRYVRGGRLDSEWGVFRQLNSMVATLMARPLVAASDPMAGFFCLRKCTFESAMAAGAKPIGYKIGLELAVRAQCRRVTEIPIEFCDRKKGMSKLTLKQQVLFLYQLISLYGFVIRRSIL